MIPAISLGCGALVKAIINVTLIPIIGINGAPIGSIASILTAMIINIYFLHKNIKLDLNYTQTLIKPIFASILMGVFAFGSYNIFKILLKSTSIATVLAIIIAVITYILSIVLLKILDKDDYHMLPYGDKMYKFLQKIKLVKPTNSNV